MNLRRGTKALNTHVSKEDIQMANRHMKKILSITNQENAIQSHMSYHLTPVRMATIKKTKITGAGKTAKKQDLLDTVGGNIHSYSHYGNQ